MMESLTGLGVGSEHEEARNDQEGLMVSTMDQEEEVKPELEHGGEHMPVDDGSRRVQLGRKSHGAVNERSPTNPLIIRVPFFLLFCFHKETPKMKKVKGYHWGT